MYTPLKLGKKLQQLIETPSVLGAAVTATLHGVGEEGLLELIVAYTNWNGTDNTPGLAELLLRALGEIHIQGEPTDQQNDIIDRASKELQNSHRQFRAAMTWLCSPKDSDSAASLSPKLLASGKVKPGRYPLVDKKSENFIRYFEGHGLRHFRSDLSLQGGRLLPVPRIVHLVDVFCACMLDRCLGRKVTEMLVKICPRCGKLFLSQRSKFCSEICQWKSYWTPKRRADDKWVKDLEKFSEHCKPKYGRSIEDLQKRLALPKTIQRLESIRKKIEKEDWAGWAKIARRIEAIEKCAAKSGLANRRPSI
jgi:hypothetical protein